MKHLRCDFVVMLVLWSETCVQRHIKGSMNAFDVGLFCVRAFLLLMRQPPSLSWPCEALKQPHGGTDFTHCSEAANYRSLAPEWEQRPSWSPVLMAPQGHRIVPTHMFGQSLILHKYQDLGQKHYNFCCPFWSLLGTNMGSLCSLPLLSLVSHCVWQ